MADVIVIAPVSLSFNETLDLHVAEAFQGREIIDNTLTLVFPHIVTQVDGGGDTEPEPEAPKSTNIVTGNVTKMDLSFKANVTAFSLGSSSEIVGRGESDAITGDYSIDVYPHTDEVMIVVAPDYGRAFVAELLLTEGDLVHPTIPNKYVYKALNDGVIGLNEPNWPTQGEVTSGDVTLTPVPLYRPLANGFVKPTIVTI
jgi:hypothetical protein